MQKRASLRASASFRRGTSGLRTTLFIIKEFETTPPRITWRGPFTSSEANRLHAAAFNARLYSDEEWDWVTQVEGHSFGWVTARAGAGADLVGFCNVISDGVAHVWLQDVIVDPDRQRSGIGKAMVDLAIDRAREAGHEWMHVDFDDDVADFYYQTCGFTKTNGGLRYLPEARD